MVTELNHEHSNIWSTAPLTACANCPEQGFSSADWQIPNTNKAALCYWDLSNLSTKSNVRKKWISKQTLAVSWFLSRCFWTEWDWGTSPERQGAPTYLERTPLYFYFSPLLQTNTGCKLTEFLKPDFLVLRRAPVGILQRFQKVGETLEKAIPFLCSLHGSPSAQGRSVVLNTRPKFYLKAKISL